MPKVTSFCYSSPDGAISATLQQVYVPFISKSQCENYYPAQDLTVNMVCAGYPEGGKDSCQVLVIALLFQ